MELVLQPLDASATLVEQQFVVRHYAEMKERISRMLSAQLDHSVVVDLQRFQYQIKHDSVPTNYTRICGEFKNSQLLGLYDSNNLLGFIIYSVSPYASECLPLIKFREKCANIECFIIGNEFRKLGHGKTMWNLFVQFCKEHKIPYIGWHVNAFDIDSQKFFKRVASRARYQEGHYTHKNLFQTTKKPVPLVVSPAIPTPLEKMISHLAEGWYRTAQADTAPCSGSITGRQYSQMFLDYVKNHPVSFLIPEGGKYGVIAVERVDHTSFVRCTPLMSKDFWTTRYAREILSTSAYSLTKMHPDLTRSMFILPPNLDSAAERCDLGCFLQTFKYRV